MVRRLLVPAKSKRDLWLEAAIAEKQRVRALIDASPKTQRLHDEMIRYRYMVLSARHDRGGVAIEVGTYVGKPPAFAIDASAQLRVPDAMPSIELRVILAAACIRQRLETDLKEARASLLACLGKRAASRKVTEDWELYLSMTEGF